MGRGIKILAVIGVLLIAVVVAGIAVLKSTDFNKYKGMIAEKAKEATGRDLVIAGDLNLEISLSPAITVDGVSFSNAEWGSRPGMVTVKHFSAEVALIPLLTGQVTVNQVVLEGVDVLAETDSAGHGNWEFGSAQKKSDDSQSSEKHDGDDSLPVVKMVRVRDLTVTYLDGKTKEKTSLRLDSVDLESTGSNSVALNVIGNVNGDDFAVKTDLTYEGTEKVSLSNMSATFKTLAVKGRLAADIGGKVPSIDAAFTTDTINVDELLPPKKEGDASTETAAAEPAKGDGRIFPNDPLPLEGLKAANANIKFDAKKIIANGIPVTDVSVTINLQGGKLVVNPLSAVVGNGKVTGNITLDATKSKAALKAVIGGNQIDYGILLEQLKQDDLAKGKVDLEVDVAGSGASVREIMAVLNGKTRIVVKDGELKSGALNIVSTDLTSVFNSEDDKKIICAVVHFDIKKGMADTRAIVFETGGFSVLGSGGANLAKETLKLHIDPRSKKPNLASAAMVPINVTGTFAKPEYAIDAAAMAGNVAAGAARVGTALATGGLSLLAELATDSATDAVVDENDYCTPALAGKKVVPGEVTAKKEPAKASSDTSSEPAPAQEDSDPVSIIKGLFD